MSEIKNTNVGASDKDVLSLDDRINKRLLQSVKVRHMAPVVCILKKGPGKINEMIFGPYQTKAMAVQDVIAIANTTKLFTGVDGKGTNASLYIEDADIRQYLGFDEVSENGTVIEQEILSEEEITKILNLKNKKSFEKRIAEFANSISKTNLLKDMIVKTGYNDAQRIKYIEEHLGIEISFDKK